MCGQKRSKRLKSCQAVAVPLSAPEAIVIVVPPLRVTTTVLVAVFVSVAV